MESYLTFDAVIKIVFIIVMMLVCVMWTIFIYNARTSRTSLPVLESREPMLHPKISVIIPARNEEKNIEECIRSLVAQDYDNYEIILIDDDSSDTTYDIMQVFAKRYENIKIIHTNKPNGWLGKTWACDVGMKEATGEIMLFTDSDTLHTSDSISRGISHMQSNNLDCLTLTQKIRVCELWTRITLPILLSFKLVYPDGIIFFSAKKVNDASHPMGGVLGAYFMVRKSVYDAVGGFARVKSEIIEDWAIGNIIKKSGYKLQMADGSNLISAASVRDLSTLNNMFKRLLLPFVKNSPLRAVWNCLELFAILFGPYPAMIASAAVFLVWPDLLSLIMLVTSTCAVVMHMISYSMQIKALGISLRNIIFAPLGGFVASVGFLDGLRVKGTCWRGRNIGIGDIHVQ